MSGGIDRLSGSMSNVCDCHLLGFTVSGHVRYCPRGRLVACQCQCQKQKQCQKFDFDNPPSPLAVSPPPFLSILVYTYIFFFNIRIGWDKDVLSAPSRQGGALVNVKCLLLPLRLRLSRPSAPLLAIVLTRNCLSVPLRLSRLTVCGHSLTERWDTFLAPA